MPIHEVDTPPTRSDLHYVVYVASGQPSWCPDCRVADPIIRKVFGPETAPDAYIVPVGNVAAWRKASNKFRNAPYNIQSVPSVVRVENGKEIARLGDDESQVESNVVKLLKL